MLPTFNYEVGSSNVTAQGNLIAQTKTLSVYGIGSANIKAPLSTNSSFTVATNGNISIAMQSPYSNLVTTGSNVTGQIGGPYFANYTFADQGIVPVGYSVEVTGPISTAGTFTVVNSGPGYANLAYDMINPSSYTGANIVLPVILYSSNTGTSWSPILNVSTIPPSSVTATIKYDPVAGIFYSIIDDPQGTVLNIIYSNDGITWNSSIDAITDFTLQDFAYDASSNLFVAAGQDANSSIGIAFNTGNGQWNSATLPSVVAPATLRSVASDNNGRFVATDDRGAVYISTAATIDTWTTAVPASYTTHQTGYPYSPLFYQPSSNTFIWANNYNSGSSFLLQAITYSPINISNLYVSNSYIQDIAVSSTQTLFIGNSSPNTSVYLQQGNTFTWLANVPNVYTNFSFNPVYSQLLFGDSSSYIGFAELITEGGGNVYANNVIANSISASVGNIGTFNISNANISGVLNVSSISNLQVNGGNVGQFIGVNTTNVLTFIDRVSFANLNLGANLPTSAAINAQLPTGLANNQQNGSMVFNTETSSYNTQPLYIYLNGAWRQMMISGAL